MKRFGIGPSQIQPLVAVAAIFSKWPTAVTVMMYICFTGEECLSMVKDYLQIKVQ